MKRLAVPLCFAALLTGCVAVPYDAYGSYQTGPVVSGYYSNGYYAAPSPYYSAPVQTYVTPAPVYVGPPIHFSYSRNVRPGNHRYDGHRHGGHRHGRH